MNKRLGTLLVVVCALALTAVWSAPARAQSEAKEKAPMYSYIGNWVLPRSPWAEMDKASAANEKILAKALASGTLVGYGHDETLIHQTDGETHDSWWCANSMAGVLNVLEQFYASGTPTSPVLSSATKHWDGLYVSRYYNWHPGTYKNVYTRVGVYKLKANAPDDAVESLSKNLVVPLLEKQLSDGAIHEYEIDEEAVHSHAPGTFLIVYVAASGEGLDKVDAAVREVLRSNPLGGSAFGSMTDPDGHRDGLFRTTATFK